jgi:tetratricopeptide (TPR) repeat protein
MHVLIVGGSRADRVRAADARAGSAAASSPLILDAATLPFARADSIALPRATPRVIRIDDLERAFPNNQTSGTRLVLTQSMYLLQKWIDRLQPTDVIVVSADRASLERHAPEAFHRRGPWRFFDTSTAESGEDSDQGASASPAFSAANVLARAFERSSLEDRVTLCRGASDAEPDSEIAALALASALREAQDLDGARTMIERAIAIAPEWEAAHFEAGKFWLGYDDMARARDSFQRAADLMPSFSTAWSNLGATLGELDDPEGAARAFAQALEFDPDSFTILNNIGVVNRELGRLDVSESALTRVTTLAPEFIFGHYNLGHTRLLRGDYPGAVAAYEEGQRRDPEKNRRQACRLALARFATGDVARAERELWSAADGAQGEEREDLLLEAYEIALALMEAWPELRAHQEFVDRLAHALTSDL